MLESPKAVLLKALIERIKLMVPEIRFITQDVGQLENYEYRPPVSWPCCLIDIEDFKFSDAQNLKHQVAEGMISLRIGLVKYTDANNLTPEQWIEAALAYYEVEQKLFKGLHGWAPDGFSRLLRRVSVTEKRDDDIKVQINKFAVSYIDTSAEPQSVKVPRPGAVLNPAKP